MADVKHCTASPINDFEGFLHILYCRIKIFTESLTEKLLRQVGWQGRVQNNRNSPDYQVLTHMHKRTHQIFSLLAFGELASSGFFHCSGTERNVNLIFNLSLYTHIPNIKSISQRIAKKKWWQLFYIGITDMGNTICPSNLVAGK
jgi:hypothetical protein